MYKKVNCPLCQSNSVNPVEKLYTKDLIKLWGKKNNNIRALYNGIDTLDKYACSFCTLNFFHPLLPGDNAFYSKLGEDTWYYLHDDKTEFSYSNKFINTGDSVLDIGSGIGAFKRHIDKGVSYLGLDLSSKAVEYAKKEGINVLEQTIEDYAFNNIKKHDVIVTFQVLEHIANIDSFIESSLQVLKKDGLFIIAVPNNSTFIEDCQNHLLNLPPHHTLHWDPRSLNFIAQKYNLNIVDFYQEKLTNVHSIWYQNIKLIKKIRRFFGLEIKSINTSFFSKLINILAFVLVKLFNKPALINNEDGMTMAIVFQNKN